MLCGRNENEHGGPNFLMWQNIDGCTSLRNLMGNIDGQHFRPLVSAILNLLETNEREILMDCLLSAKSVHICLDICSIKNVLHNAKLHNIIINFTS